MPLWILYAIYGLVNSIVTLNINILILELWARLCAFNNSIVKAFASCGDQQLSKILLGCVRPTRTCCPAKLDRLRQAHAVLHRASELLMRQHGVTMALEVAGAFSALIYCSYEVLVLFVAPERSRGTVISGSASVSLMWMTSHLLSLVALVLSCSATADEAERTTVLVVRAAALTGCGAPWPEVDDLMRQVVATPRVAFTAAGFFTIDRTLLVSALCATVTYLVILGEISLS
ncbi:putative gustatory receptor 2a [Schistocerca nitens]|uniref:putative gustatory receptor 2a n=1 Tax=Schistocerca nitens TaxID=7011 RepID=UPI0021187075|nr:putative gustatory receptor 2a [Schistocerca nitens]